MLLLVEVVLRTICGHLRYPSTYAVSRNDTTSTTAPATTTTTASDIVVGRLCQMGIDRIDQIGRVAVGQYVPRRAGGRYRVVDVGVVRRRRPGSSISSQVAREARHGIFKEMGNEFFKLLIWLDDGLTTRVSHKS